VIGLIAALPREVTGLLAHMRVEERRVDGACRLIGGSIAGHALALAITGMGADRARRGVRALTSWRSLDGLVSLGFGGALVEGLPAGAVVLATRLQLEDEAGTPLDADEGLLARLAAAAGADARARHGTSVTAARLVTAPAERLHLGRRFDAHVVDMEGYWLAREAAATGVPFVSVRAVSDTVHDHHPVLEEALGNGTLSLGRLARGYAGRPLQLARLPRLLGNTRMAADALARFGAAATRALPPEVAV
jgi:adenosylhomocysteine nucleosidase